MGCGCESGQTLDTEVVRSLRYGTRVEVLDLTADRRRLGDMNARWYNVRTLGPWAPIEGWCHGHFVRVEAIGLLARAISLDRRADVNHSVEFFSSHGR